MRFGIRAQAIVPATIPLVFLLVILVLVGRLARDTEAAGVVSQRTAHLLERSDALAGTLGVMSRSVTAYAKTRRTSDLVPYRHAQPVMRAEMRELTVLAQGDPHLSAAATRFNNALTTGLGLFEAFRKLVAANHMDDAKRMTDSPSTRALTAELEQAKTALGAATTAAALGRLEATRVNLARTQRLLFAWAGVGIAVTVALAVLFGFNVVRRLSRLAENARAVVGGAAPPPVGGTDEIAQLDGVYRTMLERTVQANRELEALREAEQRAKQHLEAAVRTYALLAAQVAGGDLGARVNVDVPDDELGLLGTSLNAMAASLESLDDEVRQAAARLASATAEILAATSQQVKSATEGASAVRETVVTVLEVRQTAETAAHRTKMVLDLAQRVRQTAQDGRHSVDESVRGTVESKERIEVLAERILAFSDQAQSIAEINATVATLAEQSNLLAVNAEIEAAKAGEAGRGFGVVAAEVKDLGTRSKEATVAVRRIVAEIQRSAQNAVVAAEQGMRVAASGTAMAQRSGDAMDTLTASISAASDAAQQISASAEQQQAGMDQIALAMQSIEQASVQSVAATQQVERAANDLSRLAQQLTDTLRR